MSLSAKQIGEVLFEIGDSIRGGMIQKIDQPQPWGVTFEIHARGERLFLYFSAHRRRSRLHLLTQKYPNPPAPPRFAQLLRAHLRWKRILSLEQIERPGTERPMEGDRIVRMTCAWSEAPEEPTISLIAELMGPASNLFLIDPHGLIRGALFPPSAGRGLEVGGPYAPPKRIERPGAGRLIERPEFREDAIPPIERLGAERPIEAPSFPFNRSVEAYYRALEEAEEREERKRKVLSALDEDIRRLTKRLRAVEAGLSEAEGAERHRIQGELLKGRLREIKPGMRELRLFDPARSEEIAVPLDPALSPSENLERFFKRYKKAQASRSALQARREETLREMKRLEDQRPLLEEALSKGIGSFPPPAPRRERAKKKGPPSFLSADGLVLIVGRNDRENEEITFRIARGNDLWFHARGLPGSHLIVRMERRREIPYQTLLDAATLALHFSDGRKAGKGDVLYTYRKYVERPRGGRPGQVVCSQEKNLFIEIEPERLERIMENRIAPT